MEEKPGGFLWPLFTSNFEQNSLHPPPKECPLVLDAKKLICLLWSLTAHASYTHTTHMHTHICKHAHAYIYTHADNTPHIYTTHSTPMLILTCTHIHSHTHTHSHIHIHNTQILSHIYTTILSHAHTHTHTHTHHTCTHMAHILSHNTDIHIWIHTIYIHTYKHTRIYSHTPVYTHTHKYTNTEACTQMACHVWQKPLQYYKVIRLQIKLIDFFKKAPN